MRKIPYLILLALFGAVFAGQARSDNYVVMFYNVENLFDTINSPGVFDEEFTPQGGKMWNSKKYWSKIDKLTEVFYKVAAETKSYPTIIGVSEVENRNVLEDLVGNERMIRANYQIVHYDSPDLRGVDVAFFYRPDQFKLMGSKPLPVRLPDQPNWYTRDVLMMWGTIDSELFCFMVMHWPSRLGGQQASEYKRMAAAQVARNAADSMQIAHPGIKIVMMGDMNDDPTDKSMAVTLDAKAKVSEVAPGGLFNPYYEMFKKGYGTLAYQDSWNLFDNMIVNYNLLTGEPGGLKIVKWGNNKFYGNIFDRPFLKVKEGQYKNYPFRTFVGNAFQNGYSDHFPVFIVISK